MAAVLNHAGDSREKQVTRKYSKNTRPGKLQTGEPGGDSERLCPRADETCCKINFCQTIVLATEFLRKFREFRPIRAMLEPMLGNLANR